MLYKCLFQLAKVPILNGKKAYSATHDDYASSHGGLFLDANTPRLPWLE